MGNQITSTELLPSRRAIGWYDGKIRFIDQTLLPGKFTIIETDDWQVIEAGIKRLSLRGAPLIGVSAALAVAATAVKYAGNDQIYPMLMDVIDSLAASRPTAVNLFWALKRMKRILRNSPLVVKGGVKGEKIAAALVDEAIHIMHDDERRCADIGNSAQIVIPKQANILTVCNAGFLATAGDGTALSAVYKAHDLGKRVHVFAPETRPLLQGARLTAWEMQRANIPVTLMVDSAVAGQAALGRFDLCIIGADRIAANGDVANKIGSHQIALACHAHSIPLYVAAPWSTIDLNSSSGKDIPIEQRSSDEVTQFHGVKSSPEGVKAINPAFDLVPSQLITGIITEKRVNRPPYNFNER